MLPRHEQSKTDHGAKYNMDLYRLIELKQVSSKRGVGLRLRKALAISWAVLALALVCAGATGDVLAAEPQSETQAAPEGPLQDSFANYQGLIVERITWPSLPEDAEQQKLRDLIVQKEGSPLDRDRIRQSIHELYGTGLFAEIRVEAQQTAGNKVELTIVTSPNYFVGEVRVAGAPRRPTAGQIVNASKLILGETFTSEKLNRALSSITQFMGANGYYGSAISAEERRDNKTQQITILFRVDPGPQARVGKVNVKCEATCSPADVQRIAKLKPKELVTIQSASRALERLRKRYQKRDHLLAQVRIAEKLYQPETNTVDYTIEINPGPKVTIIAQGFKISRRLMRQSVPVFEENAVDSDLLNEGRNNLLNYLQSRGYFDAKVELKGPPGTTGDELQIVYLVNAGAQHKLVKVEISGNQYFRTSDIRERMQVQPAGRLFVYGHFTQRLLAADVGSLTNTYIANGFQKVKLTSEVIDDFEGHENEVAVQINVDEGPQTLVGAFHILGNTTFSAPQLKGEINTAEGQPFSEFRVAQDRDNLLNYYFNHGFPRATFEANAIPMANPPNRVDVTFTITEGERVFVNHVYVSGLVHTRPYVVNRELQVAPGDPLSQIDMLQTQKRLYDLGIFNQVDTAVQNPNGNETEKNVLVDVQEARRYTFLYGFGLEFQTGQPSAIGTNQALGQTGVSPRASLAVTRLNFRGRDHTITFRGDIGSLQQRALANYVAPRWFGSANWKLSLLAFYDNTIDVTTFTSRRAEGSIQAEQIINKTSTMDYSFTYRQVKASNIQISPVEIPLLSLPTRVGEPGLSYIRNTRDNDLDPTKGMYIAGTTGVAYSRFGSQTDFSRLLIQNATYHAFGKNRPQDKKFVFARRTTVGVENAFGNTSILPPGQACPGVTQTNCANLTVIPLAERFLSGGGNSHRGFGLNQAGPRDPVTGFPLGGSALFLNNVELRLPPLRLPYAQDNMSFALFWDAGNVFNDGREMLNNLLRWSQKNPSVCLQDSPAVKQCDFSYISHALGLGVRYKTPIGPVRFDFGYNLNPPAFPSCEASPEFSGQTPSTYCVGSTRTASGAATLPYFVPQHASRFNVYFSIGQSF
ncbi:MAG TPA: POTRA domain-containing protein [Terriglobales bacterium]|nr:POTRA domain-containing protein [Terriglobales bacterium]